MELTGIELATLACHASTHPLALVGKQQNFDSVGSLMRRWRRLSVISMERGRFVWFGVAWVQAKLCGAEVLGNGVLGFDGGRLGLGGDPRVHP